jgi:integrase
MTRVRIRGIKVYRSRGKLYAYHRATGARFRSPPGTPEFFAELAAIEAKTSKAKEKPGTWGGLVFAYKSSPHFQGELKPRTKRDYNRVFDWLSALSDMPLAKITRPFIHSLRDKVHVQRKRRFANYVLAVVSAVFSFGIEHGLAHENPVSRVKKIRRPKELPRANRPWTNEEWKAVTESVPKHMLAPIMLCGLLGWREGEAISAPRTAYNEKTGELVRTSAKSGMPVKTGTPKQVAAALEALFPHAATTLLVSSTGRPWTLNGFRSSFFRLIGKLEEKGQVGPDLTCHGLRHFRATRLREAGFDKQTIADFLGQETTGMAGYYSRDADLKEKMRKVVEYIDHENEQSSKVSNKRMDSV